MKRLYRIFITLLAFGVVPLLLVTALQIAQIHRLQAFMDTALRETVTESRMPPPPAP